MKNKAGTGRFFFKNTVKKGGRLFVCAVCLCAALSTLSGCASTNSVTYAASYQEAGKYNYAVISSNSIGSSSVLQRFYAKYPSDKYEVIAIEQQTRHYLPILTGLVTGIAGGLIGFVASGGDTLYWEDNIRYGAVVGAMTGSLGYTIGEQFKDKYVITFVERPR
jgi:hypothetical protein